MNLLFQHYDNVAHVAVHSGRLDVLKWLYADGYGFNRSVVLSAAACGHFEIFKWLLDRGCPWDVDLCKAWAHHQGHYAIAAWISQNFV